MPNPILQMLNQKSPMMQMLNTINSVKNSMNGSSPDAVFNLMMQSNPNFAKFVEDNKGSSPEQIASKYGIDWNSVKSLLN